MSHPSGAEGAIAVGVFGILSWVAASIATLIAALGIVVAIRSRRGSSVAIVLAAIFVALGTLWSLLLVALFATEKGVHTPGLAEFMLAPIVGLLGPSTAWLLVAIKTRAART